MPADARAAGAAARRGRVTRLRSARGGASPPAGPKGITVHRVRVLLRGRQRDVAGRPRRSATAAASTSSKTFQDPPASSHFRVGPAPRLEHQEPVTAILRRLLLRHLSQKGPDHADRRDE